MGIHEIRETAFDPRNAKQYMVIGDGYAQIVVVDNRDRYFRKMSYGWTRIYGAPSPLPEGTKVVFCESEEDAELLSQKISERMRLEEKKGQDAARDIKREARKRNREAVTQKRELRRQIGLAHAKAMLDFEKATAHLRKQIDDIDATLDDLATQEKKATHIDEMSILESMGLEVGVIKVNVVG